MSLGVIRPRSGAELLLSLSADQGRELGESPATVAPAFKGAAYAVPEHVVHVHGISFVEELHHLGLGGTAPQRLLDALHEKEEAQEEEREEHHEQASHRGSV